MASSAEASVGVSDGPGRVATALGLLITQRCAAAGGNYGSVDLMVYLTATVTATTAASNALRQP